MNESGIAVHKNSNIETKSCSSSTIAQEKTSVNKTVNPHWTALEVKMLKERYRKYKDDNWEQIMLDIPTKTFEQVRRANASVS